MVTNCASLVDDLFLFCYERDFMKYLSNDNQAEIIKAFNPTSLYLDDLLNTPIPLDGVSATFRNFGQNNTKRGRNAKSAAETPERSRNVSETS